MACGQEYAYVMDNVEYSTYMKEERLAAICLIILCGG